MNTASRFKLVKCNICNIEIRINRRISTKRYFCKECNNSIQTLKCDRCNAEYSGIPKSNRNHFCEKCQSNNMSDLAGISSRTLSKIWSRAKLPCSICKWDECNCDIHHIVEVSKGGLDNLSNLISLCPNCHRKAHRGFFSIDFLESKSLKEFDLSIYYDKEKSIKHRVNAEYYSNENVSEINQNDLIKLSDAELSKKYGVPCGVGILLRYELLGFTRARKFNPTREELECLIKEKPMTEIGKMFGVSDNAVKKRCKKLEIELKPMRGHWMKLKTQGDLD